MRFNVARFQPEVLVPLSQVCNYLIFHPVFTSMKVHAVSQSGALLDLSKKIGHCRLTAPTPEFLIRSLIRSINMPLVLARSEDRACKITAIGCVMWL